MRPSPSSIATLVIAVILVSVSLVLGGVGAVAYHYYSTQKWADFRSAQTLGAEQLAIGLAPAAWNLEFKQITRLMDSQMQDPHIVGVVVQVADQTFVLTRDAQGVVHRPPQRPDPRGLFDTERSIVHAGQTVGQLSVLATTGPLQQALGQARTFIGVSILLFDALLTLSLYLLMQRLVLRPLRLVESYAVKVSHGDAGPSGMNRWRFRGELERLKNAIDAMVHQLASQNAALQQSAERLRQVIRQLPIPVLLSDPDNRIVLANDRFVEVFGYTLADIPTQAAWFGLAYPDPAYRQQVVATWRQAWLQALQEGRAVPAMSYQVTRRDGQVRTVQIGGMQSDTLSIALLEDITDRTQTEQELARHREHLEDLVQQRTAELRASNRQREEIQFAMDHAGIGILRMDAEQGRLSYVNGQACAMFGSPAPVLLQRPLAELMPGLAASRDHQPPQGTDRDFLRLETTLRRSDGQDLPVELLLCTMPPQGGQAGHQIAFITDISLRQASRQALIEAKLAAEAAAQARSDFLANMSHEIRTPMNAIIGMSELALRTPLDPRQRNYIDKAHRSAVSLLGILDSILDLSKIEAGRLDIEHVDLDIERVFDQLANLLALRAEEKGVDLLFDIDPAMPLRWRGDPMRLGQILINLAGNAIKFTEHGSVQVGCRVRERQGTRATLAFTVRDSGIGMDAAQVKGLFTPFRQGDNSTSRRYGGTGLGLAICKRLAELMGGQISVHSQPGRGSTFVLALALQEEPAAPSAATPEPPPVQPPRVLVLDASAHARRIQRGHLEAMGLAVHEADTLAQAQAGLQQAGPFGLVVAEAGVDGRQAAALLRALPTAQPGLPPRVVLTVGTLGADKVREATAGLAPVALLARCLHASALRQAIALAGGQGPALPALHPSADLAAAWRPVLQGARVLLVEDNAVNQEVGIGLLQSVGVQVSVASHGREALQCLDQAPFDAVLMDVQMPVMDGLQACREIRRDPRFATLPVIAMTAGALPSDRAQSQQAGMNDHLTKPIDSAALFATLARCLPRRAGDAGTGGPGGATAL